MLQVSVDQVTDPIDHLLGIKEPKKTHPLKDGSFNLRTRRLILRESYVLVMSCLAHTCSPSAHRNNWYTFCLLDRWVRSWV